MPHKFNFINKLQQGLANILRDGPEKSVLGFVGKEDAVRANKALYTYTRQ
jgi:hypothetical protein